MIPNDTDNAMRIDTIGEKIADAETPGFFALFTDQEAAAAGAFEEDAIDEETAFAASFDSPGL
ncbi:MAG: hypothetical protein LUE17_17395 [Planctomycetaceae bacterium]|nr:hypothetical protein [Planctomycetaceae bacterium]